MESWVVFVIFCWINLNKGFVKINVRFWFLGKGVEGKLKYDLIYFSILKYNLVVFILRFIWE